MLRNFVEETANNPGNGGTVTLLGAPQGRRTFAASFANGAKCFAFMDDGTQAQAFRATLSAGPPATLTIDEMLWNTAGNLNRLNFTGAVSVYNEVPAERAAFFDDQSRLMLKNLTPTDDLEAASRGYTDTRDGVILQAAKTYADNVGGSAVAQVQAKHVKLTADYNSAGAGIPTENGGIPLMGIVVPKNSRFANGGSWVDVANVAGDFVVLNVTAELLDNTGAVRVTIPLGYGRFDGNSKQNIGGTWTLDQTDLPAGNENFQIRLRLQKQSSAGDLRVFNGASRGFAVIG